MSKSVSFPEAAAALAAVGRRFYARGWVLGTSGNFSAVLSRRPLRLAITASSLHKGELTAAHILEIDGTGRVVRGRLVPSAETLLHTEIARVRGAGAILHTHSVWSTILSDTHERSGEVALDGFEMLKGLAGVRTHAHRERIPIVPNSQDMPTLARQVRAVLDRAKDAHALLLCRHGLYTWGETLGDAERHVEILEFLFEVAVRRLEGRPNGRRARA